MAIESGEAPSRQPFLSQPLHPSQHRKMIVVASSSYRFHFSFPTAEIWHSISRMMSRPNIGGKVSS